MKNKQANIGINDDYATAYITDKNYNDIVSLYYGYELTLCPKHESEDECDEKKCNKREWCFEFRDKEGYKVMYTTKELVDFTNDGMRGDNPEKMLLAGILKMLDEGILQLNKK